MAGGGASLHFLLGLSVFRIPKPTRLRFCAACHTEALRDHGELFWRRSHQLPSVLVCPDHTCVIQDSHCDLKTVARHQYICPDRLNCPPDAPSVFENVSVRGFKRLTALSRKSVELLTSSDVDESRRSLAATDYRPALEAAGLMRSVRTLSIAKFEASFRSHFADALEQVPALLASRSSTPWYVEIVRKRRHAYHPMLHLLIDDFVDSLSSRKLPYGAPPWECHNPLANHFSAPVVQAHEIRKDHEHATATFSCDCGYVYTRRLFASGVIGKPRFKEYGPLLEPAIKRFVSEGLNQRNLARAVMLDPKTLRSQARALGILLPWDHVPLPQPTTGAPPVKIKLTKPRVERKRPRILRDWKAIDQRLVVGVRSERERIMSLLPPERVTASALELGFGRTWLRKRRSKLPLANMEADASVESVADFQRRRIDAVIVALLKEDPDIQPWQVAREAGLRMDHLPQIEQQLSERRCSLLLGRLASEG